MKKNICVYTCMTGNYDAINDPIVVEDNIDYYCFTNNKNVKSKVWKVIYIEDLKLSNILLAKRVKFLGDKHINNKYKIYVWVDASITITKSINEYIDKYCDFNKYDLFISKHHCRKNISEEIDACLFYCRETQDRVERLKEFYKSKGYNYDNGLVETGVIIKRDKFRVKQAMKTWFNVAKKYSTRDQMSFNYVLSQYNLRFNYLNMNIWDNKYFYVNDHISNNNKIMVHLKDDPKDDLVEFQYGDTFKLDCNFEGENNIKIKLHRDCKIIDLNLSCLDNYLISDFKIKNKKKIDINYTNYYYFKNYSISTNMGSISLTGDFKKNEEIEITFNVNKDTIDNLILYINELNNKKK